MADSVSVRCPSCRRDHRFTSPVHPCVCGAPVAPPLVPAAAPELIVHRTWDEEWVEVRCPECGIHSHWPQPELGCPCGTLLRIPVVPSAPAGPGAPAEPPEQPPRDRADSAGRADPPVPARPSFQPVAIRTARDAVAAAELYLDWLGFRDVRREPPPERAPAVPAAELSGPGLIARVDASMLPATARDIECVWLKGLVSSESAVFFSLAGYADDARLRADELGIPLFTMDLAGSPQPANDRASQLVSAGA
ncbi:hypothetical protein [Streptomyces sp. CAU 1734]|uniref:hypothetical protein n=1 Tax=Streptomyces sp. CAU 1734 TaxID=3140360 RepID=UPI00325FEA64